MGKILLQLFAYTALFAVSGYYARSDLYKTIEESTSIPSLFYARQLAEPKRAISDKIKMFAWDDDAFKEHGEFFSSDLSKIKALFASLCAQKPVAIVIDKVFASSKTNTSLVDAIGLSKPDCMIVPVASKDVGDDKVSLEEMRVLGKLSLNPDFRKPGLEFNMVRPTFSVLKQLSGLGVVDYRNPGYFFGGSSVDGLVFRHAGVYASKNVELKKESVFLDGRYAFDASEELFVNWYPKKSYLKKTYNLLKTMEYASDGGDIHIVNEGDIVFILPNLYTGSVDIHQTPFGKNYGGYALATVADSVFKGRWVRVYSEKILSIWILISIGLAFSLVLFLCSALNAVIFLALANLFILLCIGVAFIGFDYLILFTQPVMAFNIVVAALIVKKYQRNEVANMKYHQALRGIVSNDDLDYVKKNAGNIDLSPSEQEITIMFVDFISFSTFAEQSDPEDLFSNLQLGLNLLSRVVHKHGGVVDKSLGDGLLCYFGYDPIRRQKHPDHAEKALNAAIEMQVMIGKGWHSPEQNTSYLPIRIGINTGSAIVGNVCDANKIELSIIGHDVNIAQRYEGACEAFKVMIGPRSAKQLRSSTLKEALVQKKIYIKHYIGEYNAYELDPFEYEENVKEESKLVAAVHKFRRVMANERKQKRFLVDADWVTSVRAKGAPEMGVVVNFSEKGLCLLIGDEFFLDQELCLSVGIGSPNNKEANFNLNCVVKWVKRYKDKFLHGVEISHDGDDSSWDDFLNLHSSVKK